MILTYGMGKGAARGSIVAYGLSRTTLIVFEQERKVILVPSSRHISLDDARRLLVLEGTPLERVIQLLAIDNVVELVYDDRHLSLAEHMRVIVVNTDDRTVELISEAD